jgi:hypothetical protein
VKLPSWQGPRIRAPRIFLLSALVALAVFAAASLASGAASGWPGTGPSASDSPSTGSAPVGADAARRRGCRRLHGTKRRRCRAIAKCKKIKSRKKRKKCLARARKIGKKIPPVTTPPATNLQVLQSRPVPPTCAPATEFGASNFPSSPKVNNPLFPLVPGTKAILEGRANRGGGALPHKVTFTVTDLTKVVDGVKTIVVWDVDTNEGELAESELAFFAQDKAGNVWNVGEYPEEWSSGNFAGAPSTWIAGQFGAQAGVHMLAAPTVPPPGSPWYIQGYAPSIEFFDCATVVDTNASSCVPFKCYENGLLTYETSPLDPLSGIQTKFHARNVGIVQIGALNDPEGETLVLTNRYTLSPSGRDRARAEALKLDKRAYEVSEAYRSTPPAQ